MVDSKVRRSSGLGKQAEEASLQGGVWSSSIEGSSKDNMERERWRQKLPDDDFSVLRSPAVLLALG